MQIKIVWKAKFYFFSGKNCIVLYQFSVDEKKPIFKKNKIIFKGFNFTQWFFKGDGTSGLLATNFFFSLLSGAIVPAFKQIWRQIRKGM